MGVKGEKSKVDTGRPFGQSRSEQWERRRLRAGVGRSLKHTQPLRNRRMCRENSDFQIVTSVHVPEGRLKSVLVVSVLKVLVCFGCLSSLRALSQLWTHLTGVTLQSVTAET